MAPRSGKKRFRARHPIPVWLPLPRPCLRSLNMPGSPYYMPISPEMYLPPWTLPPSYFTKPMCHCANENFCTATNCRNSPECLKMHPFFCPYSNDYEEPSDVQQNITEQQEINDDQETSSNSDLNICSTCGVSSGNQRSLSMKGNYQVGQPKPSAISRTQDSSHNVKNWDVNGSGRQNTSVTNRNFPTHGRKRTNRSDYNSPELQSKKSHGCENSSCQTKSQSGTRGSDRLITGRNYNLNSVNKDERCLDSSTDYAEQSERSPEKYQAANDVIKNEFGCGSCEQKSCRGNVEKPKTNSMFEGEQELAGAPKKLTTENIHIDQVRDNISNARARQANKYSEFGCSSCAEQKKNPDNELEIYNRNSMFGNEQELAESPRKMTKDNTQIDHPLDDVPWKKPANKYSGCCYPGPERSCKIDNEINTLNTSDTEMLYEDIPKSRKKSDCECYPVNKNKLSKCICSTNTQFEESSKFDTKLKNTNSSNKMTKSSKNRIECDCSTTKNNQKTKNHKVLKCSCPSTDNSDSHKRQKLSEHELSSTDDTIPRTCCKFSTDVKQSGCQCKFPPAYEHLSCTANEVNNCTCSNNT